MLIQYVIKCEIKEISSRPNSVAAIWEKSSAGIDAEVFHEGISSLL
jgi:hypothetical protein